MSVRIAHMSDTHLGTRFREGIKQNVWAELMKIRLLENDFYERFLEIFERIRTIDPPVKIVIHSGDLYDTPTADNPSQPPVKAKEKATEILQEFIQETGIPVIILEGNHGLYRRLDVSLLTLLKLSVPGLEVATQDDLKVALAKGTPIKYEYDDFEVFCFPFITQDILEATNNLQRFNEWVTEQQVPNPKKPSIAVVHGMNQDNTLHSVIMSMGYDYVALGHDHHQHKHTAKSWYAGSPERWRFDETRHDKGFLIVDVIASKNPIITPEILKYKRPVYNERIEIETDDTVDSAIDMVEAWFAKHGFKTEWNPETAARVRLTFKGESSKLSGLDLNLAMEALRAKVLSHESEYNIVQLVWPPKRSIAEYDPSAYPEIISEYLIEDPESDFREFLETWELPEEMVASELTKIAVKALEFAASDSGEKLTPEAFLESEES